MSKLWKAIWWALCAASAADIAWRFWTRKIDAVDFIFVALIQSAAALVFAYQAIRQFRKS